MIREVFKTHQEAKDRAAALEVKGAEFVSEYVTSKGYVVDCAMIEDDADYSGLIFNRWTECGSTMCVVTKNGKIEDFRKDGKAVRNSAVHLTRHMNAEFNRRF